MHGSINILHKDSEAKKAKREVRESKEAVERAARAKHEARYQAGRRGGICQTQSGLPVQGCI